MRFKQQVSRLSHSTRWPDPKGSSGKWQDTQKECIGIYVCYLIGLAEVLGKVYGVIARRKGTIKSEEIKEGTTFYTIVAQMPMIESFGFNDELMKKTSGVALPQFVFDGFQVAFDLDPFWLPTTEAELEDFGSLADKENLPRKYIDQVRKRKVRLLLLSLPFIASLSLSLSSSDVSTSLSLSLSRSFRECLSRRKSSNMPKNSAL